MRKSDINPKSPKYSIWQYTSINDPLFKRFNKWTDDITRMLSNVNQGLDYFPILKYLPGNNIKKVELLKLVCDTYKI